MKFGLKILPKPEVLDTQGRAVEMTMRAQGHDLKTCKVGKYLVIEVPGTDIETGKKQARAMAENGLCNALIENYELETL